MSLNVVTVCGNLTHDPRVSGDTVFLTVAVNEAWKDKEGEWHESAYFLPVAVRFPNLKEKALTCKKGTKTVINGKLVTYKKDEITKMVIVANKLERVNSDKIATQPPVTTEPKEVHELDGDSIPF